MKQLLPIVCAAVLACGCLKDDALNRPFTTYAPVGIGDGHVLSDPASEGIDPDALWNIYQDAYNDAALWPMRSLLVFRNGRLVAEAYPKDPDDITTRHLIWSATKQFTGVLSGIALEEGILQDIDDPISMYFTTELDGHGDKAGITLRHLLNMRSGIAYENDGIGGDTDEILRQKPGNITDHILSLDMAAAPGDLFKYKDGDPQLLASVLQKTLGRPMDEWAREVLLARIGITNLNWVRYKDGTTLGGFGIETTPREMAKLALCVADSGRWNGQQVVPEAWIADMLTAHGTTSSGYGFGHQWWIDTQRGIPFMSGHGGQFAFIVPYKRLLVVMTAFPNTQDAHQISATEALTVVDRIIAACD
ncbi:MAG: serine hydrolase [Flavobacteriales bacterium]|nr:serine hydrolase [Flavobacteriales bacterium]